MVALATQELANIGTGCGGFRCAVRRCGAVGVSSGVSAGQGGFDALRKIIREQEPQRPSTKLNTLPGDARTTAGTRSGVRVIGERFKNYWAASTRGHAEQVELTVLNDSTARTAALQSGRVNIINRVDPKVVDLIKRAPGVTIQ